VPGQLVELVKAAEGFHRVVRLRPVPTAVPYLCPANFWTRGYGILCQPDAPEISQEAASDELLVVLPSYQAHALRLSPALVASREERLTAITDFCFNLGPTRYAASTLRRLVNAGRWAEAAVEIRKWVWGGGRKLPGLIARREIEAHLLLV
jgi:lysozyme